MMALTSCIEEQPEIVVPTPGEGVKFYASLNNIETKTIYGDEVYGNGAAKPATAIKVNWVDGDMISVYGTTCLPDRNQGQYKVEINDDNYSYASNLEMVGDHGVQWGTGEDSKTSDFYAVYPSVAEGAFSKNDDGNIVVSTSIRSEQKNVFVEETTQDNSGNEVTIWSGTPYIDVTNNNVTTKTRTMPDALMYSYTPNVSSGSVVNLNFKPFATVLKFSIDGWSSTGELKDPTVYVQKIILTAPSNVALAGDCTFTFNSNGIPTAKAGSSTSNVITIDPVLDGVDFLPLKRNDKVEFNVFVIPQANNQNTNNMVLNENWNVRLETTHGNFTFKLNPTVPEGKKAELIAGEIHKIKIPQLVVESQFTYDNENWIEAIPRNVYLSEISIPGAWYATNSTYQGGKSLSEIYNAGVRAFNIDCRLTLAAGKSLSDTANGGFNTYSDNISDYNNGTLVLACSGTESGSTSSISSIGMTVKQALKELGPLAVSKPKEFIQVVLTVAQKPNTESTGITYVRGTVNPELMMAAISDLLNDPELKDYLYLKQITPNTTVNDVLGKIVVKVNLNASDNYIRNSLNMEAPMLISQASMAETDNGNIVGGIFNEKEVSPMYWSTEYTSDSDVNYMLYIYHQAQLTRDLNKSNSTSGVSFDDRKSSIKSIVETSKTEYDAGNHNKWFQISLGGSVKYEYSIIGISLDREIHGKVAAELNDFMIGLLDEKNEKQEYSPVGVVLMNLAAVEEITEAGENGRNSNTTYQTKSSELIQKIIDMNGKFWLNRDETKPEWPV